MKIAIGTFAHSFKQSKIIRLVYKNENGNIYSIKLPFGRFVLLTFKNKL